jgi:enamine deaminase RidA (YjgF/YER057c/UK114 family)
LIASSFLSAIIQKLRPYITLPSSGSRTFLPMMALKNEVALDGTLMTAICLLDESKRPGQEPTLQQDMRGQYLQVMEALTIRLRAAGATWDDVVYRRPFVLDMDAFIKTQTDPTMTYPWHRPPPSTLVGIPDFPIEIDLMAVTKG